MQNSVKVGFSIRPLTKDRINQLSKKTFRSQGDVIDWLVDEAWKRLGYEDPGAGSRGEKVEVSSCTE